MKRSTAKALLENGVFQKWANGETLEVRVSQDLDQWVDLHDPRFDRYPEDYRIKTKIYKPFSASKMAYYMENKVTLIDPCGNRCFITLVSPTHIFIENADIVSPITNTHYKHEDTLKLRFENGNIFGISLD